MKVFGVQLRSPGLTDLPVVVFSLACSVGFALVLIMGFGLDLAQVSGVIFGFAAAGIASACGVGFEHGLRGMLIALLIALALAASAAGLYLLFS